MGANQKYSGRVHTKRQLGRAVEHIHATALVLTEIQNRYYEAAPIISKGCEQVVELLEMIEVLLVDMKGQL